MASEQLAKAITTKQRIKDRLQIEVPAHDVVIERLVSAITEYIEGECGRVFKTTTYTNEVHSIHGVGQPFLALKQSPVTVLTTLEYRAGTVSTPNWTAFTADQFELSEDGKSGLVRIYGGVPRGTNNVRATYTAGYLIDFDNPTDATKHTLPADLSDLAEVLISRRFKKRDNEGRDQESFEGGSITWGDLVQEIDRDVINRYRRLPEFV